MSCFWKSILGACRKHQLLWKNVSNVNDICKTIISLNRLTSTVTVNEEPLTKQQQKENFEAVKNYNVSGINNGHLTSTCDYFLCLVAELTNSTIIHNFNGTVITYFAGSESTIRFQSDLGHFWLT